MSVGNRITNIQKLWCGVVTGQAGAGCMLPMGHELGIPALRQILESTCFRVKELEFEK